MQLLIIRFIIRTSRCFFHSQYFGSVTHGEVFASFSGSSVLLPDLTITRDKVADEAALSPELLFPDLNVFARKMLYDSQGL